MKALLTLATVAVSTAAAAQQSDSYWLGEARGPHKLGTTEDLCVDDNRGEALTSDPNDKRHLMIRTWYPASFTEGAKGLSVCAESRSL